MPDETQAEETRAQAETQEAAQASEKGGKKAEAEKPAAEEPVVKMTVAQYQAFADLQRQHEEFKAKETAREEKREQDRLKLQAEKDGIEKALETQRDTFKKKEAEWEGKYNSLHQAIAQEKVDATIAAAIAGRKFIGQTDEVRAEAARDFQALMRASGRFSAVQDAAGKWTARETATGRDASEVLAEEIKRKSYLFEATTQGGVQNGGNAVASQEAEANEFGAGPMLGLQLKGLYPAGRN